MAAIGGPMLYVKCWSMNKTIKTDILSLQKACFIWDIFVFH